MKKKKAYIYTSLIVVAIFLVLFITKGIFPFGKNSLIWGDMHDQITAFYYHFYDSIIGNSSLLVNFSTSGGINFIGVLAYYILSPVSFVLLLFPREDIYLAVSILIAIKVLLCSLTCLYFIQTYFKKISCWLSIFLAVIYAFSGYSLIMYQITPWIDAMYLLPLVTIGLKKVLDLERPTFYITFLTISLITSFYVSLMTIIFIFLISLIYLLVYKDKLSRKKAIFSLGISTIISLLLACFVIVPAYLQISVSSRLGFNLSTLLNSGLGPITDKIAMFMFGGLMYAGIFLLIKNYSKNKQFLKFYIPSLLILLIPVIVEPVNKLLHFGSYVFFPYRFGFITMFLLIIGACYGFENHEFKTNSPATKTKIFILLISMVSIGGIIYLTRKFYHSFQIAIDTLTISSNRMLFVFLLITTLLAICACLFILLLYKKIDVYSLILIGVVTITHITCNVFLYMGIDFDQENLTSKYESLTMIEKNYEKGNYYRVKNNSYQYIMNSGMVMKYHTLDHFTSLTDKNNLLALKKLGYSSMWVKTYSKGGTLFTDALLANKYVMTDDKFSDEYYEYKKNYKSLKWYEQKQDISYGYFISNNFSIMNMKNSFEIQNKIYNSITGDSDLFTIIDDFDSNNIEVTKDNDIYNYEIIDKGSYTYLEKELTITDKSRVYLELLGGVINKDNENIYEKFNIYINDKLFMRNMPEENDNGLIDLGTYENEKVNIKLELLDDVYIDNITIGIMNNSKYEDFTSNNINTKVEFKKNKINIKVDSDKKQILFLPITYNDGYSATANKTKTDVIKVFDNYIGVMVDKGTNNITLSFVPKGFELTLIVSFVTLILTIILFKSNLYNKLIDNVILCNIAYYTYLFIYLVLLLFIYILMTICFMLSYFIYL